MANLGEKQFIPQDTDQNRSELRFFSFCSHCCTATSQSTPKLLCAKSAMKVDLENGERHRSHHSDNMGLFLVGSSAHGLAPNHAQAEKARLQYQRLLHHRCNGLLDNSAGNNPCRTDMGDEQHPESFQSSPYFHGGGNQSAGNWEQVDTCCQGSI